MSDNPGVTSENGSTTENYTNSQRGAEVGRRYVRIPCRVEQPMNNHGALRLSATSGRRTFQVVDYATEEIRLALGGAVSGTTVRVRLVPLNSRGNAWRVTAVAPGNKRPDRPRILATD